MDREIWHPVVGHSGEYEVSSLGRVRSLDRVADYKRVDAATGVTVVVTRRHRGKILTPGRMSGGHMSVALGRGNSRCVHALVLEAFVGPRPRGLECLHRNGNASDNRLENLRWGSRSENIADAIIHGVKPIGSKCWNAILTEAEIPIIRERRHREQAQSIADRYGVSEATIRAVAGGKTWKHVR